MIKRLVILLCLVSAACVSAPIQTPPHELAFYRLRIEYSSTSDWTTLEILNPEAVLGARLVETLGDPIIPHSHINLLDLRQPLESAMADQHVGITVDLAMDANNLDQPLEFLLQKGNLNRCSVRIYLIIDHQLQPIHEVIHEGTSGISGFNPLDFRVDLRSLSERALNVSSLHHTNAVGKILAFYYPWYWIQFWASPSLADWPLMIYASDDPGMIRHQIEQAKNAGIDGFICNWVGPGSDSDDLLRIILDIAEEENFFIGIQFITWVGDGPLEKDVIREWLTYAINTHGTHPAYMQIHEKPLIVFYASNTVPLNDWNDVFVELHDQGLDAIKLAMRSGMDNLRVLENLSIFDGLYEYGLYGNPDPLKSALFGRAIHNYSLLSGNPATKIWAAPIQPGYDDRRRSDASNLYLPRTDGAYYQLTFEAALAGDPDLIFIFSWNKWTVHNHIEPSVEYGDQYLILTRQFAQEWKGQ
ncbi:MAG: endo-1,3-alpha-glucanase family glycosylhydrolase [Anaerolineales bacterium]